MSSAVDPKIEVLKIRVRQSSVLMERLNHLHNVIADQFEEIAGKLPVDPQPSPERAAVDRVHGACDLQVWESESGRLTFSFDLQPPFYLPARLGRALLFLATEPAREPSPPGLLGYRKRSEIKAHLQKTAKDGRTIRPQYVNNITNLLKAAIIKHTGRDLIKTNDEWGVRLLLKAGGLHGLEATSASRWL